MEMIVLGLLMLQNSTIYEMRKNIETWFSNISSNSTGSIQVAIKKLSEKGFVQFSEHVENSVNKKVYAVTEAGRAYFSDNIASPMQYKEKNMELSKFFFMGFVDKNKRVELINAYIAGLRNQLDELERINAATMPRNAVAAKAIEKLIGNGAFEEITQENAMAIAAFQYATLDLGIDKTRFEIEWFEKFKQSLV